MNLSYLIKTGLGNSKAFYLNLAKTRRLFPPADQKAVHTAVITYICWLPNREIYITGNAPFSTSTVIYLCHFW